jgi:predicted DNA-binding transcriptional regulator AlpA
MAQPALPLPPPADLDPFLGTRQVAQLFGVTPDTVRNWAASNRLPAPARYPTRRLRWRRSVILKALEDAAPGPLSEASAAAASCGGYGQ